MLEKTLESPLDCKERLAKNDFELLCLRVLQHPFERRPVRVHAGIVLVAVQVKDVPALFHGITDQDGFLILNALGLVFVLVLILSAESAIDCT